MEGRGSYWGVIGGFVGREIETESNRLMHDDTGADPNTQRHPSLVRRHKKSEANDVN